MKGRNISKERSERVQSGHADLRRVFLKMWELLENDPAPHFVKVAALRVHMQMYTEDAINALMKEGVHE